MLHGGALKVDWWDIEGGAAAIRAVLREPGLAARLRAEGRAEAAALTWRRTAEQCVSAYEQVTRAPWS